MRLSEENRSTFAPGLYLGFAATLGIAIFVLLGPLMPFIAYNIFQAIFITSAVYLTGIGYGVFNALLSTTEGGLDFYIKWREFESNNQFAVSFTAGIIASWWIALPAAILFGIAAVACNFLHLPNFSLFLPIMIGATLFCMFLADHYSKIAKNKAMMDLHLRDTYPNKGDLPAIKTLGCETRNVIGYAGMALLGLGGLITYITIRALGTHVPTFSLPFYAQIIIASALFVALVASTLYTFNYHPSLHEIIRFPDEEDNPHHQIPIDLRIESDLNKKDANNLIPIQVAIQYGNDVMTSLFLQDPRTNTNINVKDEHGRSLLHLAVLNGRDTSVIQALLNKGCDRTAADNFHRTPAGLVDTHYNGPSPRLALRTLLEQYGTAQYNDAQNAQIAPPQPIPAPAQGNAPNQNPAPIPTQNPAPPIHNRNLTVWHHNDRQIQIEEEVQQRMGEVEERIEGRIEERIREAVRREMRLPLG